MTNRIKDKAIFLMIEQIYEHETSMVNWDSSFIESVYDQYVKLGGVTEAQLKVIERKYENMNKEVTRN